MAKVKIQGHASGTGILTVTAPNTSTDRTITLPDATGTLLNSDGVVTNLSGVLPAGVTGGSGLTHLALNPTVTLGSNATFPATHPDTTIFRPDWNSTLNGSTETTAGAYQVWSNKRASSTVHVEFTFHWKTRRTSGGKTYRAHYVALYSSTSAVADGATSSFGTKLAQVLLGRALSGDTSSDMPSFGSSTIQGAFTSGSANTNYYIGVTHNTLESSCESIIYGDGDGLNSGTQLKIIEV